MNLKVLKLSSRLSPTAEMPSADAATGTHARFGYSYNNDTGLVKKPVLSSAFNFTMKEIEVFKIIE
jgi:hypothetical protein